MLKLRLKRYGKKREPSYRIIAIESRTRRQARPLEELGFYNPRTKETVLETAGILKWLRQGAQPTETLESILRKAGILEMLKAGNVGGEDGTGTLRIPAIAKVLPVIEEEEPEAPETSEVELLELDTSGTATPEAEISEDPVGEEPDVPVAAAAASTEVTSELDPESPETSEVETLEVDSSGADTPEAEISEDPVGEEPGVSVEAAAASTRVTSEQDPEGQSSKESEETETQSELSPEPILETVAEGAAEVEAVTEGIPATAPDEAETPV